MFMTLRVMFFIFEKKKKMKKNMCTIFKWYIQQVKKVQEQAKVYIQLKFYLML